MEAGLLHDLLWGIFAALAGGIVFTAISLICGSDETSTIAPLTLLVILLGFPPVAVLSWFMAATVSKHMIHAIPTALMGIPGDTMAIPMLENSTHLRRLGVPHIALRKMISGGLLAAFIALPFAIGFGFVLAPLAELVRSWAGVLFTIAAIVIAYTSSARWASLAVLVPFAIFMKSLSNVAATTVGHPVFICMILGLAVGPLFADLITILSVHTKDRLERSGPREFWLAPEVKMWAGYFPNPLKVLTRKQIGITSVAALITSATFTFSPIAMTVIAGEIVSSKIKGLYDRLTTSITVMNGVTESTYISESLLPLVAFGIPLSPISMGVAFPLYYAPPIFTTEPVNNLHNLLTPTEFIVYGYIGLIVAALLAYPFSMNYARRASIWVMRFVSQEALIAMFTGLIVVLSYYEAEFVGIGVAITVAIIGGILNRYFGIHAGVQYMTFYASGWIALKLFGIK